MKNPVLLDTVGLVALWNRKDQWHAAAKKAFEALTAENVFLATTTFVLLECGNAVARYPAWRAVLVATRAELLEASHLLEPTVEDCEQAWTAFQRGEAGNAGIVDHVSFVVMRRLGLTEVFTNDAHFRAAGFTTLF